MAFVGGSLPIAGGGGGNGGPSIDYTEVLNNILTQLTEINTNTEPDEWEVIDHRLLCEPDNVNP
ncbi:MAG: hypothetical protein AAFO94_06340 [Bacteroidota bacterium]